jgi:hypothetical protein
VLFPRYARARIAPGNRLAQLERSTDKMKKIIPWILLCVSVAINLGLGIYILIDTSSSPSERRGILKKDVVIGIMGANKPIITLPKGLAVEDASPRGFGAMGLFEANRFSIIVTSDDDLVDYSTQDTNNPFGNKKVEPCG